MSELKDYSILDIEAIDDERFKTESAPGKWVPESRVYLKSEADKVIAELKEKHKNEVKELLCLIRDKENNFNRAFDSEEKEIRHNKYKRCLGIAAVCFEKSYSTTLVKYDKESGYRLNFYDWWGKRWLELAKEPTWEKFLQLIHKEGK